MIRELFVSAVAQSKIKMERKEGGRERERQRENILPLQDGQSSQACLETVKCKGWHLEAEREDLRG